jgi:hypothetical protein
MQIFAENLKLRDQFGHLGEDERIILKWVLKKLGVRVYIGFIWLSDELL